MSFGPPAKSYGKNQSANGKAPSYAAISVRIGRIGLHLLTAAVFCLSLALWVFFTSKIPFNDDQWIHFHPIACHLYPNGMLHRQPFREWCGSKDLILWGMRLPLRAYSYIGVTQVALFLPFWKMFQAPVSLHVFNGVLWFVNSLLLSRLLMAPWFLVMCVVMASSPIFSQHVIDTGPFSAQFTMILLAILIAIRAVTARTLIVTTLLSVLVAVPAFLAFEQKATAVFAIPAAVILFLGGVLRRKVLQTLSWRSGILRFALMVMSVIAVLAPLIWYYINLRTPYEQLYRGELLSHNRNYSMNQIAEWRYHADELFRLFVLYPSSFFHRVFGVTRIELPRFPQELAWIFGVTALLLVMQRRWSYLLLLGLSLVFSVVTFIMVARSTESWAGHHVVYSLMIPFFALAVSFSAVWPRLWWCVLPIVARLLYIQVPTFIALATTKQLDHSDRAKEEILALVNEPKFAESHVVVHLSWGAFYQDSLFGPTSQILTWSDYPKAPEIAELAAETGRRVAYIRLQSDPRSRGVPEERGWKLLAVSSSGGWELWEQ